MPRPPAFPSRRRRAALQGFAVAALLGGLAALQAAAAQPQASGAGGIYTCVDDRGRRLTSDRPIAECTAKEQQILNRDGSLKGVLPPTLTADERAAKEARDRKEAEERAAQADAVRRDRNLLQRFPDEETHQRSREAAIDTVLIAIRASELRLRNLAAERKPLMDEAEFYIGKPLPPPLKAKFDANDAAVAAQRTSMQAQEAELERINKLYDVELERLRKLWAGASPGTLGPIGGAERGKSAKR